jgi:hypothetical protein
MSGQMLCMLHNRKHNGNCPDCVVMTPREKELAMYWWTHHRAMPPPRFESRCQHGERNCSWCHGARD